MYGKILVPVDGSAASNLALLEAIKLVKSMSGTLRLVHVVDEFIVDAVHYPGYYSQAAAKSLVAAGRSTLEAAQSVVRQHALQAETVLVETVGHRVADHVVAQAREWPADLIVIGTHGRRGVRRLLMGSDGELIVRSSPVPVLLVREQAEST